MLKQNKQINKMGVKKQTNKEVKEPVKKKQQNKVIWECLCCSCRVISIERPTECPCSNPQYVINTQYKVGE